MSQTVGGRYALDGRLGEGGMGWVYKARHLQLGKLFALKIISPAFALDARARERFNQEAQLASEITHPNIVSVVDFGEDPAHGAYMVMELVEGEPLVIDAKAPMSVRRACDVLGQVADALDHIHKRGIVHGDIKADNIMLAAEAVGARRRRIVRLLDFGLARRHTASSERETHISGSPHYLAPERVMGEPPSVAGDVYALGVLGYLMLTGRVPFDSDGPIVEVLMAHVHDPAPPINARRAEPIDPALEALVMRTLAKDPAARHASAGAFKYELNTVMDMLDLRRRSSTSLKVVPAEGAAITREAMLVAAFDRSRLPQAMCALSGELVLANKAFLALLGEREHDGTGVEGRSLWASTLAAALPGLEHAFGLAHASGKPQEKHARIERPGRPPLELTAWISPLPIAGQEIHLVIRVEELLSR